MYHYFSLIVLKTAWDRLTLKLPVPGFWLEPRGYKNEFGSWICHTWIINWYFTQYSNGIRHRYGVSRAYFIYFPPFCCFRTIFRSFCYQRRPVQFRQTPPEPLWDTETPSQPTAAYCPTRWREWAGSLILAAFHSNWEFDFYCWLYQRWKSGNSIPCASSTKLMVISVSAC